MPAAPPTAAPTQPPYPGMPGYPTGPYAAPGSPYVGASEGVAPTLGGVEPAVVVGPPARTARRDIIGGICLVGMATVAAFASFLRWVTAELPELGVRIGTGWENVSGEHNAGAFVVALAVVIAVFGALVATGAGSVFVRRGLLAATLLLLAIVAWEWFDLLTPPEDVTTSPGIGLVLLTAASVVAVGLAVVVGRRPPSEGATVAPARAVGAVG